MWWLVYTSIICILAFASIRAKEKGKYSPQDESNDIRLTPIDVKSIGDASISVATIFESETIPISWIWNRVFNIIKLNPWLNAELVKYNEVDIGLRCLKTPSKESFQVIKVDNLTNALNNISSNLCGAGPQLVDEKQALFKVTLLFESNLTPSKQKQQNKFALVVSMAHVLGDAATFYAIYGMLNDKTTITALNPERVFVDQLEATDAEYYKALVKADPPLKRPLVIRILRRLHKLRMDFGKRTEKEEGVGEFRAGFYPVKKSWIQAQKDEFKQKNNSKLHLTKFISTNDLLLSEILPKDSLVSLSVNMRLRIKDYELPRASSYSLGILLYPNEHAKPETVRQSLSTKLDKEKVLLRAKEKNQNATSSTTPSPTFKGVSLITNWASFYKEVHLGECESKVLAHIPLFCPEQIKIYAPFVECTALVFQLNEATMAVRIQSRHKVEFDHVLGEEFCL